MLTVKPEMRGGVIRSEWPQVWDDLAWAIPFWEGGGSPVMYVRGGHAVAQPPVTTAVRWTTSRFGKTFHSNTDGAANVTEGDDGYTRLPSAAISCLMLVTRTSSTIQVHFRRRHATTTHSYGMACPVAGVANFNVNIGGVLRTSGNTGAMTIGTPNWFLGRWQSGQGAKISRYDLAGALLDSGTESTVSSGTITYDADQVSFGSGQQDYHALYCFPRYMNDNDDTLRRILADPWAPFRPARRRAVAAPLASGPAAALSGTALASIAEGDIRAGGKTLLIDLTGATWLPS